MTTEAKPNGKKQSTIRDRLNSPDVMAEIARALPKHMSAERMARVAITALTRTPKLNDCTQASFLRCLMDLSQWGLEPDGRRAHLIPYGQECTLIIDYKGYVELAMRSGTVASIHADVICEADEFEYDRGSLVHHRVNFRDPRGEAYAAYCLIRMKDGSEKCEVIPKEDVYAIRDRAQGWLAYKSGKVKQSVWNPADPHIEREMWKKTAFRRASKWIQLSAEIQDAFERDADSYAPLAGTQRLGKAVARSLEDLTGTTEIYAPQSDERETVPAVDPYAEAARLRAERLASESGDENQADSEGDK